MPSDEILVVTGEASGDLHAAPVVEELTERVPGLTFFGTGGRLMMAAGVELLADVDQLAVIGFSDIPRVLPRVLHLRRSILKRIRERRIPLAILVDYPGFNLNLARALKRLPDPPKILYYIAPQVWAWGPRRIETIRRLVDMMAVVLPFEADLFRAAGVPVTFVGHPLIDELNVLPQVSPTILSGRLDRIVQPAKGGSNGGGLALLPGSRRKEVTRHLPVMLRAAELLRARLRELTVAVGCAPNLDERLYRSLVGDIRWVTLWKDSRALLASATAAAICSGTATLEAALLGVPQVVVYRTSRLNYHLIKRFIRLSRIALVNLVAGEELVVELLQRDLKAERLAEELEPLLTSNRAAEDMKTGYEKVRTLLGEGGAARKVAGIAMELLAEK